MHAVLASHLFLHPVYPTHPTPPIRLCVGHLCRSTVAQILTHDQLASLSSLARHVRFAPKEVIYSGGDPVNNDGLFFIIEGSSIVSKYVELREATQNHNDLPSSIPRGTFAKPGSQNSATSTVAARWANLVDKPDNAFEVKLRTFESKAWFGYCTMLNMGTRQATVTAAEHTTCLVWSDSALNEFFSQYPGTSALLRDGIAGQRVMRELCNASFLTNLQEEHSALLCTLFQPRYIPANTVVFEEGEPPHEGSSLFFLVSGSAVMYQSVPGGGSNLVKAIEPVREPCRHTHTPTPHSMHTDFNSHPTQRLSVWPLSPPG